MGSRWLRATLAPLLIAVLLVTTSVTQSGCAAGLSQTQRRHCRALRRRAVGRAIGLTLGAIVVVGVVVAAAAAGGSSPNFGGGHRRRSRRRQARRQARLEACRAESPQPEAAITGGEVSGPAEVADSGPPQSAEAVEIPIVAVEQGPPSVEELDQAIAEHADAVRSCQGPNAGVLYVDARIQGQSGGVIGVLLHGPSAVGVEPRCVYQALQGLRVRPFPGVVDVRWAIEVNGAP